LFAPNGALFCLAHSETVGQGYDFYWSPEGDGFCVAFILSQVKIYFFLKSISMSHHHVNQLIHVMWSVSDRQFQIPYFINKELHAYVNTVIQSKNGKTLLTGGSKDHIHLLIDLPPELSLSDLLGHVKAHSSKWIKSKNEMHPHFSWQSGYLAISTQHSSLDSVCAYIRSDEENHRSKNLSYEEELRSILKTQNIKYDEKYILQNSFAKVLIHAVWYM